MKTKTLDYTSGIASFLCAIHYAALPLVIGILPALGLAWIGSHEFGATMVLFTIVVGTWAIIKGYKEHRKCWPLIWFGIGIIALVVAEFVLHDYEYIGKAIHHCWWFYCSCGAFTKQNLL